METTEPYKRNPLETAKGCGIIILALIVLGIIIATGIYMLVTGHTAGPAGLNSY